MQPSLPVSVALHCRVPPRLSSAPVSSSSSAHLSRDPRYVGRSRPRTEIESTEESTRTGQRHVGQRGTRARLVEHGRLVDIPKRSDAPVDDLAACAARRRLPPPAAARPVPARRRRRLPPRLRLLLLLALLRRWRLSLRRRPLLDAMVIKVVLHAPVALIRLGRRGRQARATGKLGRTEAGEDARAPRRRRTRPRPPRRAPRWHHPSRRRCRPSSSASRALNAEWSRERADRRRPPTAGLPHEPPSPPSLPSPPGPPCRPRASRRRPRAVRRRALGGCGVAASRVATRPSPAAAAPSRASLTTRGAAACLAAEDDRPAAAAGRRPRGRGLIRAPPAANTAARAATSAPTTAPTTWSPPGRR